MDFNKPQILNYDKDEKCQVDFTTVNPILKNALVGDCNNEPIALKRVNLSNNIKDNNIQVFNQKKYKTKEIKTSPRRPGLMSYDIKFAPPKCNSPAKNMIEMKNMVEKCGK
jgi:hypothetical protein